MSTFHTFTTAQEARDYRHTHGTGGWIFAPAPSDTPRHYSEHESILFPPEYTPSMIFRHPMTVGRCGELLSN